jgi:hypothetical protein
LRLVDAAPTKSRSSTVAARRHCGPCKSLLLPTIVASLPARFVLPRSCCLTQYYPDTLHTSSWLYPVLQMATTILRQSHLCPLPLSIQPIYWEYDHALRLFPLPDAVIIGEDSSAFKSTTDKVLMFNPGSLVMDGTYAAFSPCRRTATLLPKASKLTAYGDAAQGSA